jgi:hypothetical protein
MGLTPGHYSAALDTAQLHLLDFEALPGSISFTIANSEEGVIADGFQFTVISHKDQEKEVKQVHNLQAPQSQSTDSINQEKYSQSIRNDLKNRTKNEIQSKENLNPVFNQASKTDLSERNKQLKISSVRRNTSVLRIERIGQKLTADSTSNSHLIFRHDTNTLVLNQQVVDGRYNETGKITKPLSDKKVEHIYRLAKERKSDPTKTSEKKSQSKTGNTNANRNNKANINKPKVGSRKVVSSSPKKVASKNYAPAKKKTIRKTNDQRSKTGPSAEDQHKLLEQLQRLLKKVKAQKAEMALMLSFNINEA